MEALVASAIGVLVAGGIYLVLRLRTFDAILGLTLLSYGVNLYVFAMGRLRLGAAPIVPRDHVDPARFSDPLPQALVLTAIVIGFAMTAFLVVLAIRSYVVQRSDAIDGRTEGPP